jgi:hypothetical protein
LEKKPPVGGVPVSGVELVVVVVVVDVVLVVGCDAFFTWLAAACIAEEKPPASAAFTSGVGLGVFVVVVVVVVFVVFVVFFADDCDAFPLSCSAVPRKRSTPTVEAIFVLALGLEVVVVVVVVVVVERAGGGDGS